MQVFGCIWDQQSDHGEDRFLTFGIRHIKMWAANTKQNEYKSSTCSWLGATPRSTLCAAFLPENLQSWADYKSNLKLSHTVQSFSSAYFVTGHLDGKIRLWKGNCCIRDVQCHGMFGNVEEDLDCTGDPMQLVMNRQGVRCIEILQVSECHAEEKFDNDNAFLMVTGGADGILKFWTKGGAHGQVRNPPITGIIST